MVPDNSNELPTFNLAAATGSLTYAFKGKTGTNFTECLGLICSQQNNLSKRLTIDEFEDKVYSMGIAKGLIEGPYFVREDSVYVVVNGPTWEEAEANAVKLGGHLATISDEEENKWIVEKFNELVRFNGKKGDQTGDFRFTPRVYIGLNDKEKEGEYKWSSGEEVTFFQPKKDYQMTGENQSFISLDEGGNPKVQYVDQDFVSLQLGQNTNSEDWNPGYWEDIRNDNFMYQQGIAEIKIKVP